MAASAGVKGERVFCVEENEQLQYSPYTVNLGLHLSGKQLGKSVRGVKLLKTAAVIPAQSGQPLLCQAGMWDQSGLFFQFFQRSQKGKCSTFQIPESNGKH